MIVLFKCILCVNGSDIFARRLRRRWCSAFIFHKVEFDSRGERIIFALLGCYFSVCLAGWEILRYGVADNNAMLAIRTYIHIYGFVKKILMRWRLRVNLQGIRSSALHTNTSSAINDSARTIHIYCSCVPRVQNHSATEDHTSPKKIEITHVRHFEESAVRKQRRSNWATINFHRRLCERCTIEASAVKFNV